MRTNRGWFQARYRKGYGHHHLHLAGKGAGKLYSGKKWRLQGYSDWRLLAKRSGNSWLEEGHLCNWFGEQIWFSLASPELEVKAKIQTADHCWLGPDCFGLITSEVVAEFVGQNSIVKYDLTIVFIYLISQHTHTSMIFIFIFRLRHLTNRTQARGKAGLRGEEGSSAQWRVDSRHLINPWFIIDAGR